ncbi:tRNA-Thr(GGU) m(6)t(6)A37 methyltransferase TsaA [Alteromonadaceae bacterium Bs31]|nr:tRNA-Thr(GGU) m(6)t(6)A37 methyltransferase TsaA [Alteromonadaceae bacterium Bs31]
MHKNSSGTNYQLPVIGIVRSDYKQKFGIPRQAGLVPEARATLELIAPYNNPAAFEGLSECSHIWLQFIFHQSLQHEWRPKVRPPRLGGNKSVGVFATRAPVRPAAIGLSVVKLEKIELAKGVSLHISGADLLDETPVLDIKPYLPYADSVPEAVNLIASAQPDVLPVNFSPLAESQLAQYLDRVTNLRCLVIQVLRQDPRPSYQRTDSERVYAMQLNQLDIRWRYFDRGAGDEIEVMEIVPFPHACNPQ